VATYLVIGVVGLVVLGVSLLAGDFLDGTVDAIAGDWFSSAVAGGFVSAFGFGAASAVAVGAPAVLALPVGVGAGVLFGWFATWLTRVVRNGGSDDAVQPSDAVGHSATVLTGIPDGGFGVVRVRIGGHVLQLNARADDEVPAGAEVYVTGVLSPTAVTVAPTWNALT
jgi:membrane protein implicated in regulation of membrane protease activity